jgi:hypothetical protein
MHMLIAIIWLYRTPSFVTYSSPAQVSTIWYVPRRDIPRKTFMSLVMFSLIYYSPVLRLVSPNKVVKSFKI